MTECIATVPLLRKRWAEKKNRYEKSVDRKLIIINMILSYLSEK